MTQILSAARVSATAFALSILSFPIVDIRAAPAVPSSGATVIALSTLGDLSSYRSIAQDTLALVDKGDITAARARIRELEAAWDKAEPSLKPKDAKEWTAVDSAIDAALADLRTPSAKPDVCRVSLEALIAKMDVIGRA